MAYLEKIKTLLEYNCNGSDKNIYRFVHSYDSHTGEPHYVFITPEQDGDFCKLTLKSSHHPHTSEIYIKTLPFEDLTSIVKNFDTIANESSIEALRKIAEENVGKFSCTVKEDPNYPEYTMDRYWTDNFETGFHLKGNEHLVKLESEKLNMSVVGSPETLIKDSLMDMKPYQLMSKFKKMYIEREVTLHIGTTEDGIFLEAPTNDWSMIVCKNGGHTGTVYGSRETFEKAVDFILRKANKATKDGVPLTADDVILSSTELGLMNYSAGFDAYGTLSIEGHDVEIQRINKMHHIIICSEDEPWTVRMDVEYLSKKQIETLVNCLKVHLYDEAYEEGSSPDRFSIKDPSENVYIKALEMMVEKQGTFFSFEKQEKLGVDNGQYYAHNFETEVIIRGSFDKVNVFCSEHPMNLLATYNSVISSGIGEAMSKDDVWKKAIEILLNEDSSIKVCFPHDEGTCLTMNTDKGDPSKLCLHQKRYAYIVDDAGIGLEQAAGRALSQAMLDYYIGESLSTSPKTRFITRTDYTSGKIELKSAETITITPDGNNCTVEILSKREHWTKTFNIEDIGPKELAQKLIDREPHSANMVSEMEYVITKLQSDKNRDLDE